MTTNLANVTSARVWSTAKPSVATVSNALAVTSVSAGTSLINYTVTINVCGWVSSQLVTATVSTFATLFTQIDPICENATAPFLPGQSNDLITGSWSPNSILTVNLSSENGTIHFFSVDRNLIETRVFNNLKSESFDVQSLSSGVYFFQTGNSTERVIVQ